MLAERSMRNSGQKFNRSIGKVNIVKELGLYREQVRACHTIDSTYEQENDYDTTSTDHTLRVNFVPESSPLVIESIIGSHHRHWYTSSNWRDKSESRDYTAFNSKDIPTYQAILDETTTPAFYGISHDYALSLFKEAKSHCSRLKNERIIKREDKTWVFGGIDSTLLIQILSYAKTFSELFFTFDYARSLSFFAPLIKDIGTRTLISVLRFIDIGEFYHGYSDELSYGNKNRQHKTVLRNNVVYLPTYCPCRKR